jgi:hypothetical protein
MSDNKRKILIIENQEFQYSELLHHLEKLDCLKKYDFYPTKDDYVCFIDNVRVWVNKEYKPNYITDALNYLNKFIVDKKIELILVDHILGGAHHCFTGIRLAEALNETRTTSNTVLPVIFISKTEHTDKTRITDFESYKSKYPNTSKWVHKGYFGDVILEPEFLKKNVVPEIEKLLKKSLATRIIEKLNEKKPIIIAASETIDRDIATQTIDLIEKIANKTVEANDELLSKLTKSQLSSDYLSVLESANQ